VGSTFLQIDVLPAEFDKLTATHRRFDRQHDQRAEPGVATLVAGF
jgi:hypothetical protein